MRHNPGTGLFPGRPGLIPAPRPVNPREETANNPEATPVYVLLPGSQARTRAYLINDLTYLDQTGARRVPYGTLVETPNRDWYVMTRSGGIPASTLSITGGVNNNLDTLRAVQARLNELGYTCADGRPIPLDHQAFGERTLHAVNWFKDQNLPNGNSNEFRGVVGHTTLAALFADSAPRANPNYRPSRNESIQQGSGDRPPSWNVRSGVSSTFGTFHFPLMPDASGGLTMTSGYGPRGDIRADGTREIHRALDFAAPSGTRLFSVAPGVVTFSGWVGGYGNTVIIKHDNGYYSKYSHNATNNVTVDQRVNGGDFIATVGSTGNSTGPHLDFQLSRSTGFGVLTNQINPTNYFPSGTF